MRLARFEIEGPRDRSGSSKPVIVPTGKRSLHGTDEIVLLLSAGGLTTGEIAEHFEETYRANFPTRTRSGGSLSKVVGKLAG